MEENKNLRLLKPLHDIAESEREVKLLLFVMWCSGVFCLLSDKFILTNSDYYYSIDYSNSLKGEFEMQKLFDSEIKVMEIIWTNEPVTAKQISLIAAEKIGWNKNTTYTVIKKLESKGFIKRNEPGFVCISLVSRDEIQRAETQSLVDKLFGGSKKALFSALLEDEKLSSDDLEELRGMIEKR